MKTAHIGRNLEWEYKKILESQGFTVTRSAGSHGTWDLVAYNKEKLVLIECISRKGGNVVGVPKDLAEFRNCPLGTEMIFVQKVSGEIYELKWVRK